jgi:phosphomannomutase
LVRASNTEPIVRVIAEAPQATEAKRLCAEVGKLIR